MRPLLILLMSALTAGAQTPAISSDLKGKLVAVKNKMLQPIDAAPVTQAKYIAFYFGASWCGPCHKFTPELASFYNEMKPKHSGDFEVVFVSEDTNPTEMQNYMNEMSMPWPALRWDAVKFSQAAKLAGPGIPSLVVVDNQGRVVSNSFEGKNYLGPRRSWMICENSLTKAGRQCPHPQQAQHLRRRPKVIGTSFSKRNRRQMGDWRVELCETATRRGVAELHPPTDPATESESPASQHY